jgi:hypothetical protein
MIVAWQFTAWDNAQKRLHKPEFEDEKDDEAENEKRPTCYGAFQESFEEKRTSRSLKPQMSVIEQVHRPSSMHDFSF